MKKIRQASHRKESTKKVFFLFVDREQFVGFLFFVMVLLFGSWTVISVTNWIDNPERVVLSQLTLTGDHAFTQESDIRYAILGLGLPNTYIAQNVDDIQQEIMRLPWIKHAIVRKQWPDRLIVNIIEYQPHYVWNEVFLLDDDGIVFSVPKDRIDIDLMPKLSGPIGKETLILSKFKELNEISKKSVNRQLTLSISEARADERNAWTLIVNPCVSDFCVNNQKIILKLGRKKMIDRYERFIHYFSDIQAGIPKDERFETIDLRYENGIAVKKKKLKNN